MKPSKCLAAVALSTLCLSLTHPSKLNAANYESEYSVTILGLSVGKVGFKTTIDDEKYTLDGSVNAAGVAKLFSSMSGNLQVRGRYANGKVSPTTYKISYKEGKKSKITDMTFDGAGVTDFSNKPATKKRGEWVDLEKAHLKNALDPITATLVSAKNLRSVCENILKIFDGAMVAEFPMNYLRTIPFSAVGYKGDAVTCRAQFKPISGYDQKKTEVKWMRDNGYADISFAPVGDSGLYAPVVAKIKTQIGTASIRALRFQTLTQ